MFEVRVHKTKTQSFWGSLAVIYHVAVRESRTGHRNALVALILNMVQSLTLIIAFLIFFQLLGMRSSPIRGDFLLFLMSGIFLFMTHIKTLSAVAGSGSATSPMLNHGPMNTFIAIMAAAISTLYIQLLTIVVILLVYHTAFKPITIHDPVAALGFFMGAWFTGFAVGLLFLSLSPWIPDFMQIIKRLYIRINMLASGKMFLVNTMPATMVDWFDWNPLFHLIDQMRGAVFLHYNPFVTSTTYPIYVACSLLVIGMMGEFFSRQHASLSWKAGR